MNMQSVVDIHLLGEGSSTARLSQNLEVLGSVQPELAARLAQAGFHQDLQVRPDDRGTARVGRPFRRRWLVIEESEEELATPAPEFATSQGNGWFLLGLGTGERARALLNTLPEGETLTVWESDPSLMLLALSRWNVSGELMTGKLRLLFGSDLVTAGPHSPARWIHHPKLAATWPWVMRLVSDNPRPNGRLIAIMEGELLVEDLSLALHGKGHPVYHVDAAVLSRDQIADELERLAPQRILSINFQPELARIAGELERPYVPWEIDPSASTIPAVQPFSPTARWTRVHTWRRSRVPELAQRGWEEARWLPLAVSPRHRQSAANPREDLRDHVIFVGSCMASQGRTLWAMLENAVADDGCRAAAWRAFGAAVTELESRVLEAPTAFDPLAVLDALRKQFELPEAVATPHGEALVVILAGERLASAKRIGVLRALAEFDLAVFGEEDWAQVLPEGAYRGWAGHRHALNAIYSAPGIHLDVNRIYQPDIVTLRTFEITACGGFVIAEETEEIHDLFDVGRELTTWKTLGELKERVGEALENPERRLAVGSAGQRRLLRDHTVEQRLRILLA